MVLTETKTKVQKLLAPSVFMSTHVSHSEYIGEPEVRNLRVAGA